MVQVPESATARGKNISVFAALDERRRLWLHVDSLRWLIQYIRDEKENGGVAPVEEAPAVAEEPEPRIYWNFRDDSWTARAQAKDGKWVRTSRGVKRRRKDGIEDFQLAKQRVYEELEKWVDAVAAGDAPEEPDNAD